jgi:integrase
MVYFGGDKDEAIFEFHQWESKRGKKQVQFDIAPQEVEVEHTATKELSDESVKVINDFREQAGLPPRDGNALEFSVDGDLAAFGDDTKITSTYNVLAQIFWGKARELILNDIDEARKLLNINIKIDADAKGSIKIANVYEVFKRHPKYANLSDKNRTEASWKEFLKSVGNKPVQLISLKDIIDYRDYILSKKNSPKTVSNTFGCIKDIIKTASRETQNDADSKSLVEFLNLCKVRLYAPKQQTKQTAKLVSKQDFHNLFNATNNVKHKLILLLGLNCAMKSSDICDIKISNIDFVNKSLVKQRHKTKIIRAAVLWDITLDYIKKYLAEKGGCSEYLLTCDVGKDKNKPFRPHSINDFFNDLRDKANVSKDIKFEQLRDSVKTVSVRKKPELLKATDIIMGHKGSIGNQYLERQPEMVAEICKIVYDYYFA